VRGILGIWQTSSSVVVRLSTLSLPHRLMSAPMSVAQSRPDGVSSVQFTNLLSRLLEQVLSPQVVVQLATEYTRSPFYHANMTPFCFYTPWLRRRERPSLPLHCSLLSHHRLLSLQSIRQSFHRLTQPQHHLNRRERGSLKQSFCEKFALDPV